MNKLRPAGQTRPPEKFYPTRDTIPNLTNEKKKNEGKEIILDYFLLLSSLLCLAW
jgi:hypothetical protein